MTAQMRQQRGVLQRQPKRLAFQRADAERRERRHGGGQEADRQQLAAAAHAAQQQDRAGGRGQQHDRVGQRMAQRHDADQRDRRREQQRDFLLVGDRHGHAEQHERNQSPPATSWLVMTMSVTVTHDQRQQRGQPAAGRR